MKKIVFVLAFLFSISFQIKAQWFWQNPLPQGNNLLDVFFIDENTGWAVGVKGSIIHTTDGGESWKTQLSPHLFSKSLFIKSEALHSLINQ